MKKYKANIFSIALALLLIFVVGMRVISPAVGFTKTAKEITTSTGESDDKTNSEKQTDNQEDFNKEKVLSASSNLHVPINIVIAEASFFAYIDRSLPTHHFTIISPPPDLAVILKS